MVDSAEGAPAYQDVCDFLEHELLLMVPREMRDVPVLVVVSHSLTFSSETLVILYQKDADWVATAPQHWYTSYFMCL